VERGQNQQRKEKQMDNYENYFKVLRFQQQHGITIEAVSASEFRLKSAGTVSGIDTTRVYTTWDQAATVLVDAALKAAGGKLRATG
jgi:hypothetical protein